MVAFADNKEFRAVLYDLVKSEVDGEAVDLVLDKYAEAIAIWLKSTEQPQGGYLFGRNNEFVFRIHDEPERIHHGDASAEGVIEPSHFSLYIKAAAPTLRVLSEHLGKEVKNG